MHLLTNWRAVLLHAWSIRIMFVAALFSGLEVALPLLHSAGWLEWMPRFVFALLSFFVTCIAVGARLVAQKKLGDKS